MRNNKDMWVRSITKAATWRILGILILILLCFSITGNLVESSLITFVFHAVRMILYVLHERAWELTAWGCTTNPCVNMFWFYFWQGVLVLAFAGIVVVGRL
ncbi:MAG TPA: DUF2061 domain-containing protein [Methanomicrobia archaeon]|nr:DUF2061 domain-containing protein [Methanomicrobia archaeon]